jgi:hypothetical protein
MCGETCRTGASRIGGAPSSAAWSIEHYDVSLRGVTDLTVTIRPDLANRALRATLTRLALQ